MNVTQILDFLGYINKKLNDFLILYFNKAGDILKIYLILKYDNSISLKDLAIWTITKSSTSGQLFHNYKLNKKETTL